MTSARVNLNGAPGPGRGVVIAGPQILTATGRGRATPQGARDGAAAGGAR